MVQDIDSRDKWNIENAVGVAGEYFVHNKVEAGHDGSVR